MKVTTIPLKDYTLMGHFAINAESRGALISDNSFLFLLAMRGCRFDNYDSPWNYLSTPPSCNVFSSFSIFIWTQEIHAPKNQMQVQDELKMQMILQMKIQMKRMPLEMKVVPPRATCVWDGMGFGWIYLTSLSRWVGTAPLCEGGCSR